MSEASSAKGIKLTIEDVSIGFNLVQTHVEELMDFILTKKCSMFCLEKLIKQGISSIKYKIEV